MSNSELLKYATESAKVSKSKSEKEKSPSIDKCSYMGCPMNASTLLGGRYSCSFHESPDFHQDVTTAIISNMDLIRAYNRMVKWSVSDWNVVSNKGWLLNNSNCPMTDGEMASSYINRYFTWLSEKIKSDASSVTNYLLDNSANIGSDY